MSLSHSCALIEITRKSIINSSRQIITLRANINYQPNRKSSYTSYHNHEKKRFVNDDTDTTHFSTSLWVIQIRVSLQLLLAHGSQGKQDLYVWYHKAIKTNGSPQERNKIIIYIYDVNKLCQTQYSHDKIFIRGNHGHT